jgi:hypothetical protein
MEFNMKEPRMIVTTTTCVSDFADYETQMFDFHVWESLFPWESPVEMAESVFRNGESDCISAESLAEALWLEMFDGGERVTFCDMIADDIDHVFDVDDDIILRSLARNLHWKGGVRSIFE